MRNQIIPLLLGLIFVPADYKYSETPPSDVAAPETLWLEPYLGDNEVPVAFVSFAPASLASSNLHEVRDEFKRVWP